MVASHIGHQWRKGCVFKLINSIIYLFINKNHLVIMNFLYTSGDLPNKDPFLNAQVAEKTPFFLCILAIVSAFSTT